MKDFINDKKVDDIEIKKRERLKKSKKNLQRKSFESFNKRQEITDAKVGSDYIDEVYDPLSKDMDNDGVIDRYDNDENDSDISYQHSDKKLDSKKIEHNKKLKDKKASKTKINAKTSDKKNLKAKSNLKKADILLPIEKTFRLSHEYLETTNDDDNSGVKTASFISDKSSRIIHHARNHKAKKSNFYNKSIKEKASDKLKESATKKAKYKAFIKKRQMKKSINKHSKNASKSLKNTAKNSIKNVIKLIKSIALNSKVVVIVLAIILLVLTLFLSSFYILASFGGGLGMITESSYKASDNEISIADNLYKELETNLEIEIENVEENYPNYDEYRYSLDYISHDSSILIAYLSAKYEKFDFSMVEGDIISLFNEVYSLSYREKIETYTVTRTRTVYDEKTGESYEEEYEVEKEKKILITTLSKKDIKSVIESRLDEEQKEKYEILMDSLGNFNNLHSPIVGDWKSRVTSHYGYRIHPIKNIKSFHTGIDIAAPLGTEILSLFDGKVVNVSYDEYGYGNYVEIMDKHGNIALFAHLSSSLVSVSDEVKRGDVIALMGSTGSSTGSHLHLELHLEGGIRVNPYFYLENN